MEKQTGQHPSGRVSRQDSARALEVFERRLVERKVVPDAERLLMRRFAGVLQVLAAIAIGILAGSGSILFTFLVFNKLLHL